MSKPSWFIGGISVFGSVVGAVWSRLQLSSGTPLISGQSSTVFASPSLKQVFDVVSQRHRSRLQASLLGSSSKGMLSENCVSMMVKSLGDAAAAMHESWVLKSSQRVVSSQELHSWVSEKQLPSAEHTFWLQLILLKMPACLLH